MEFFGILSLENNGGFASIRSRPANPGLDADDTLVVRLKGDGGEYVLYLHTQSRRTAFSYRAPWPTTKDEWPEDRVRLTDFVPTLVMDDGQGRAGTGAADTGRTRHVSGRVTTKAIT
jgi:NADH dehydrogenase [ubiquinone] 1 alpha subcomplex assembly factor 1